MENKASLDPDESLAPIQCDTTGCKEAPKYWNPGYKDSVVCDLCAKEIIDEMRRPENLQENMEVM